MNRTYGVRGQDPHPEQNRLYAATISAHALPAEWDFSYLYNPVEDQGPDGTCTAFGVGGTYEAFYHKRTGTPVKISKRAQYSLTKHTFEPDSLSSEGAFVQDAIRVLENLGYVKDEDWPYGTPTPDTILQVVPPILIHTDHDLKGFDRVLPQVLPVKQALVDRGMVVVGLDWQYSWEYPNNGILPQPNGSAGGHCVSIVGYSESRQAFHIRNSWGPQWGEKGYCWMPYSFLGGYLWDAFTIRF